ncbi:hypothetical protein DY218_02510 [Streptomyces triticagri]|uniref:Transcription regulator TrmB N-terminal domain-containing protein n=1 Tax=Streptomyces triticagri TaxID=2293568 RepID=A0A372MD23_9ACTN|nr:helix-turn-helix domain-containing protein [Streptomyces triticagri]RFU88293.1 hypothetical protein DY218_02510 [Streptomyces triticagri]
MTDIHTAPCPATTEPESAPLPDLTGAPAAAYTALSKTPNASAAELALAAGIGRSTAGKALALLENQGLATRTPGERTGTNHTPDRWHCTPPADDTSHTEPNPTEADVALAPEAVPPGDAPTAGPTTTTTNESNTEGHPAPPTPSTETTIDPTPTSKTRLAPGALRQQVLDYLTAHPGDSFTATAISRSIERSSGAIANSLVTLTKHGAVEQTGEHPRTYQLAPSTPSTE